MAVLFRSRDVPTYLPLVLLDNTGTGVNGVVTTDFAGSAISLVLNGVSQSTVIDGYHVQLVAGPANTGVYYIALEAGYWGTNFGGPGAAGTASWIAVPAATKFVNFIGNGTVMDIPNLFWDHGVWRGALMTMGGAMRAMGGYLLGRLKVDTISNTRTVYKEDNVTPLAAGATLNQLALPSSDPIFETVTEVDTTPPTATASVPTNGATNVSINTIFDVTFSEEMDPTTMTATNVFIRPTAGSPVAGTITQLSTKQYRFTPSAPLSHTTAYQGVVLIGAKDPWGNALSVQYVAGFTTS